MAGLGIAEAFLGVHAETGGHNPLDDFWYGPVSAPSATGLSVTSTTALQVSAVRACVALISETIAQLHLPVYRNRDDGGRESAPDYPLYRILHDQPNAWQSSGEFIELLQAWALLLGDGYAEIVLTPRGFVDQLIPIHPQRVRVEDIPGGWRYTVRQPDGTVKPYNRDDLFHLPGFSMDGIRGLALTNTAKEAIGMALAAERYGSMFFGAGARPSFALKTAGKLERDDLGNLKEDLQDKLAGLKNAHKIAVLEDGLEPVTLGINNDESQLHQLRVFQVEEIARSFRVPLHMISSTTKETSWGSGIAQMSLGFVIFTLTRHLRRWEQAVGRQLIPDPHYFAEFVLDGLLRGDPDTRAKFYAIGRQWGWLSVNDIRRLENQNPIGPDGDIYLQPSNMAPPSNLAPGTPVTEPNPEPAQDTEALLAA